MKLHHLCPRHPRRRRIHQRLNLETPHRKMMQIRSPRMGMTSSTSIVKKAKLIQRHENNNNNNNMTCHYPDLYPHHILNVHNAHLDQTNRLHPTSNPTTPRCPAIQRPSSTGMCLAAVGTRLPDPAE